MQEGRVNAIDELLEAASDFGLRQALLQQARCCLYVCDDAFHDWLSERAATVPGLRLVRLTDLRQAESDDAAWILCVTANERALLSEVERGHPERTVLGLLYDLLPRCISRLPVRGPHRPADRRYMVLSVPRSGSHFLCGLLEGAGIGAAREHLRTPVCDLARRGLIDLVDWLERLASCVSVNGWLGTKLISHYLFEALDSGLTAEAFVRHVSTAGYRVIRIVRQDKVQQAVSNFFSRKTDVWTKTGEDETPERPGYDFDEILSDYEFLKQQEEWLQRAVDHLPGVHTVRYEDLARDVDGTMQEVCALLGEEWKPGVQPRTMKQRDAYSRELARRFELDLARRRC